VLLDETQAQLAAAFAAMSRRRIKDFGCRFHTRRCAAEDRCGEEDVLEKAPTKAAASD
jgi:hypothetical protein